MIAIVDLGMGNVFSVRRALEWVGRHDVMITDDATQLMAADAVVLPGVGHFRSGMEAIKRRGLRSCLIDIARSDQPLLGICLGMQLLMDRSEEGGDCSGLGVVPGTVQHFTCLAGFDGKGRVPFIGWGRVDIRGYTGGASCAHPFQSLPTGASCYFVHSYCCVPEDDANILSRTSYGGCEYASAIVCSGGTTVGCQFHPEKSGEVGLGILRSFLQRMDDYDK